MRFGKLGRFAACVSAIALVSSVVRPASAGWPDQSDELPGMMSTKKLVLIGLGTAAAATLIYVAASSGGNSKAEAATPADSSGADQRSDLLGGMPIYTSRTAASQETIDRVHHLPVGLTLNPVERAWSVTFRRGF